MGIKTKFRNYLKRIKKIEALRNDFMKKETISLDKNKSIFFDSFENPAISIIVCLRKNTFNENYFYSLKENTSIPFELILVLENDATENDFSSLKGIQIFKENGSFISKINSAIEVSKADYIYLLNSQLTVDENYLEELISVFENFSDAGLVGSQIISQGLTQQGLFFDGKLNQSNPKPSYNPEVNYVRRTDYFQEFCFLLKKKDDSGNVIHLNEKFDSIAAASADLCFDYKFKQQKQIYLTPFSKVFLNDNASKSTISISESKDFNEKWQNVITNIRSKSAEDRIQEIYENKTVVVFCGMFPEHDKDSGSNRLKEIIEAFRDLKFLVTVVCRDTYIDNSYIENYLKTGINVFYEHDKKISIKDYLYNQKLKPKLAWFYGPNVFMEYYRTAKKYLPMAKLAYDMVDIHHLRFERAIEIEPLRISLRKKYKKYKKIEIEASKIADYVIAISDFEEKYMADFCDVNKIKNISNVHYPKIEKDKTLSFEERKDILFIGSMHSPNIDSLYYLYKEIMPLVWDKIPELKVNIIGNVKDAISDINHPNFIFLGYVRNIEDLFVSNKLMVAPLRFGAGVKGKIGQSLEYYLPAITSTIGAEGMKLINGESALIEDTAEGFATAIINLYNDKELWQKLQDNSEKSLEPFSKETLKNTLLSI